MLVEEASGNPTKVRPTRCRRPWAGSPAWSITRAGGPLNGSTGPLRRLPAPAHGSAPSPSRERTLTAGRDAALLEAEQIATRKGARSTETAVHRTRVLAGGLTVMNCAVDNYDDLTVGEVATAVQRLTDAAALTALLRYEQNHKDRAGAVTGIENRLAALAEQHINRN